MNIITASAAALALSAVALPAVAQNVAANNLINVQIDDAVVLENIANDLNIEDVADIPVAVSVPVGIAAAVCNIQANVLAQGNNQTPGQCDAENTTSAFNQAVLRQMNG